MNQKLLVAVASLVLLPAASFAQNPSTGSTTPSARPTSMGTDSAQTGTGTTAMGQNPHAGHAAMATDPTEVAAVLHHVNLMETELGKLVEKNSQSSRVKQYAKTIVKDHTKAESDLQAVVRKSNLSLDTANQKPMVQEHEQKSAQLQTELKNLRGTEFDTRYLSEMVNGHQATITMLEGAATTLQGQELGKLVTQLMPKLKQHLSEAEKLQSSLGGKTSGMR
jgi:putative membrane protein